MWLIDAHQDLAWNTLAFDRDYTRSAHGTREHEQKMGSLAPLHNGDTLLGWPDYQAGQVAVIFSTLFAAPIRRSLGDYDWLCYEDANSAHAIYQKQLDVYSQLADEADDKFRLVLTQADLKDVLNKWEDAPPSNGEEAPQIGLVVLMEGAEGIRGVEEVETWWEKGVRLIGPAWAGNRYCGGTGEPGPLTSEGYALLEMMAEFNIGLDLSHMDEQAVLQALDSYPGVLCATHANAAALLKGMDSNRFLSDRVIQGIVERDGVIGVTPANFFLKPGWRKVDGRHSVSIDLVVDHIDHICQIAGDPHHVGVGSDFDGGFGWQSVPEEIDTIADLNQLVPRLANRGYSDNDIQSIMGQNWQRILDQVLPG